MIAHPLDPLRREHQAQTPRTARWFLDRLRNTVAQVETVDGHDHSHWQNDAQPGGAIPYEALKAAGHEFVIIKATEGKTITDSGWAQNWQAAHAAGLRVCVYHFFRSNIGGNPQAEYCLGEIADFLAAVDYSPIIFADVETNDGVGATQRTNRLNAFFATVQGLGEQVGVYSSPGFWNGNIDHDAAAPFLPTVWQWVAHWTPAAAPATPTGWSTERMRFWQKGISGVHSWCPPVPEPMQGNADYNVFFGTAGELDEVLGVAPPIPGDLVQRVEDLERRMALAEGTLEQHGTDIDGLDDDVIEVMGAVDRIEIWGRSFPDE